MKKKNLVKAAVIFIALLIVLGITIYIGNKPDITNYIDSFTKVIDKKQNTYLHSIITVSIIFILSLSIIGLPIILIIIGIEYISIGFTISAFYSYNHLKGIIFYIIYYITSKILYILLITYFTYISVSFIIKVVKALLNKEKELLYKYIINQFYRYIIVLVLSLIVSTITYFIPPHILKHTIYLLEKIPI